MDITKHKKFFIIFLIVHITVWTMLCLVRDLLPTDALETIVWGELCDFGTHKHPPLAGWISSFIYNLFGRCDIVLYFTGQLCVAAGFIYLYKSAKLFMCETSAMCSVILCEGCYVYSYMSVFDGFNPNFLLFMFLPAIFYYFYRALTENNKSCWLLTGLVTGLALLSKYQAVLLIFPMFLFLLVVPKNHKSFLNPWLYLSAIVTFLVFLPHLLWLNNHNYFSLLYFSAHNTVTLLSDKLLIPFEFIFSQLIAVAGSIFIFLMLYIRYRDKTQDNPLKNSYNSIYIILLGILPVFLQAVYGFVESAELNSTWGYPLISFTGIMLFYFFPLKSDGNLFLTALRWAYYAMAAVFVVLLILFSVELNFRSRYPYEKISADLTSAWESQTGKPLKYIAGYIEYALPLVVCDNSDVKIIFDTYRENNPWIDITDAESSGVLIVASNERAAVRYADRILPFVPLNHKFKPHEYQYIIYNKFGKSREYTLYYLIVPPSGSDNGTSKI